MKEIALPTGHHESESSLVQRGRRLEYLTIGWNLVEASISAAAGLAAGSIALVGFGIDALIETASGLTLLWRLQDGPHGQRREERALRLVGVSFLALAAYVGWEAIETLRTREAPESSPIGIAIATLSLLVMPFLARAKRKVARQLGSQALEADSRQTNLCAWLSAILLFGLLCNSLAGWWWADPVAALGMTPIILREAWLALQGKPCHDCHAA
ncbi:MAG: cation diffusion facilitator family transporter [Blastocatellia bacterium]